MKPFNRHLLIEPLEIEERKQEEQSVISLQLLVQDFL